MLHLHQRHHAISLIRPHFLATSPPNPNPETLHHPPTTATRPGATSSPLPLRSCLRVHNTRENRFNRAPRRVSFNETIEITFLNFEDDDEFDGQGESIGRVTYTAPLSMSLEHPWLKISDLHLTAYSSFPSSILPREDPVTKDLIEDVSPPIPWCSRYHGIDRNATPPTPYSSPNSSCSSLSSLDSEELALFSDQWEGPKSPYSTPSSSYSDLNLVRETSSDDLPLNDSTALSQSSLEGHCSDDINRDLKKRKRAGSGSLNALTSLFKRRTTHQKD